MILREMTTWDLDQVMEIENSVFSIPWSREGFFSLLIQEHTLFFVVEEKERILAYCGLMVALDEGDVLNVAVRRERRREGIGFFMLEGMLRIARDFGVTTVHLEVRKSNDTARRLYERAGFIQDGLRRNYYSDPVEDAVLMTRRDPAAVI